MRPRSEKAPELEDPGVRELAHVREDRAAVDEIEGVVLERQVWKRRCRGEAEGRAQVLLAPRDVAGLDVDAPVLAAVQARKETQHPTGRAAEVEHAQ